jgi:hypothetical protein
MNTQKSTEPKAVDPKKLPIPETIGATGYELLALGLLT